MFDNGSFLRRRKRYKRTSLAHNVPFPGGVFSPFSPFWVRKPVPVLPIQFGAGGFPAFQDNFDVFSGSAGECFVNRNENKLNAYRDDVLKSDVLYENRAKLEFLRRNMDAFRRGSTSMDLFSQNQGATTNKTELFENLNRESNLLNLRHNSSFIANNGNNDGSGITDGSTSHLCDKSEVAENTINYFCYDNDDHDLDDESNDKIDVVTESEEYAGSSIESGIHKCNNDIDLKLKSVKPFLNLCKTSEKINDELEKKEKLFGSDERLLIKSDENDAVVAGATARDLKESEEKLLFRVYSDMSPEHNVFTSNRSSNASAEYNMDNENDKQLWQNTFPTNSFNKKCFESTVLDYEFATSQKKRKYGNAKGFSIENLIGNAIDER